MSQTGVLAQVNSYLTANASTASGGSNTIPLLNVVYSFPPKFTPEGEVMGTDLPNTSGISSGAAIYLYIPETNDERIALGGEHNGRKMITYDVHLICVFFSEHSLSQNAGADNLTFTDGLKTAIRADRTCGGSGPIFQWGEGSNIGGRDIYLSTDLPRQMLGKQGKTVIYSLCKVTTLEIIDE